MSLISRNVSPCPLCGSEAVLLDTMQDGIRRYFVYCLNHEHCGLGTSFCATPEEALQEWKRQDDYARRVNDEKRNRG